MNSEPVLKEILKKNPAWETQAICKDDPDLFFGESAQAVNSARKICVDCPVIAECFAKAVLTGEHYGVWGGHTTSERPSLRHLSLASSNISRKALSEVVRKRIRP